MPYDGGDLYVRVEAYLNGTWTEITSRALGGRAASGVAITQGRGDGAIQAETSRLDMILGNADGYVTEGNPASPYYPYFGRGTRIRVSLADILGSGDAQRFCGRIDTLSADYPGGSFSSLAVTAVGTLGSLGQGSDPLKSALERAILADSPVAMWALNDASSATQGASSVVGGTPMVIAAGSPTWGSQSPPDGGDTPLVAAGNATLRGAVSMSTTSAWSFEVIAYVDEQATDAYIVGIDTDQASFASGSTFRLYTQTSFPLPFQLSTQGGSSLTAAGQQPDFDEQWHHYLINVTLSGTNMNGQVYYDGTLIASGNILGGVSSLPLPRIMHINPSTGASGTARLATMAAGYAAVYNHANVDAAARYQAMLGWVGEMAHERIDRLFTEEGYTVTIVGSESPAMGPQSADTLLNLARASETVGQGLLHDGGTDGAVVYVCASELQNQTVALAITAGTLEPDLRPIWDNQNTRNDVTSTRPGGLSIRVSDEDHVTRVGIRFKDSRSPNVETDDQLVHDAGWWVNTGTADGPRYAGVGFNMRNSVGRTYADQVLALTMGQRFTVAAAALPSQHPPGGIDSIGIGWTERLDADTWTIRPHAVPYAPYVVAEMDSTTSAKLDSGSSTLTSNIATSATSISVTTSTSTDLWTTSAGQMPISIVIDGEVMTVSAISGGSSPQTFTVTRAVNGVSRTHSAGAEVHVYHGFHLGF